jgi:hypothetical protein
VHDSIWSACSWIHVRSFPPAESTEIRAQRDATGGYHRNDCARRSPAPDISFVDTRYSLSPPHHVELDRRDSAAYVVSTLNLVHCRDGRSLALILSQCYPGARYDVFVDQQISNLFFIEPRRADGSTVGALAYQLGWVAPMSVTSSLSALYVRSAPAAVYSEFRTDAKQFIGTFSSTVPT